MGYSPVYSTPFIQYTKSTPNNEFLVPVGATAIIRQISATQDAGTYDFECVIADSEIAPYLVICYAHQLGALQQFQQEGRWVVPGGGLIAINATTVGLSPSFYVGGYLLPNQVV